MASKNNVFTHARRVLLARITSGDLAAMPRIAFIALGDGGLDADGNPIPPEETQTELKREIGRYGVAPVSFPVDTTSRYSIVVPEADLIGKAISEVGLIDEDGTLHAARTCSPKVKDSDEEFTFVFDDEF